MTFRTLTASALAVAVLALPAASRGAVARDLAVIARGAAFKDLMQGAYGIPFAATGQSVQIGTWAGGLDALRQAADANPGWDVVQVNAEELLAGCAAGWFEKLDWNRIGGRDHYLPQGVSDCGVGTVLYDYVLAWERDKFQGTPSWQDFWDVAKYPGKRGLRRGVKGNLEIALLADGVAPGDVYRLLRTDEGVDRAFRKLDQLKPYLVWWGTGGVEAPHILGSGEVLMTSAPNIRVPAAANGHRFGLQWSGSLSTVDSWVIMKGSPDVDGAYRFLALAGDPKLEKRLIAQIPYGALAKGADDGLPPEIEASSPSSPDNLRASLPIDEAFWHDNLDKLSGRFDAWLAH